MEFREGASVYTSDGKEAGRLHRVVIHPETNEVTHIVVQRGLFNKEDKVVPVVNVASATQDEVHLQCSGEELNEMPPLKIAQFVSSGTPSGNSFTSVAAGFHTGQGPDRYVEQVRRTIPDELVALKEGAPVVSVDNERVGHVERVVTHPEDGQVTHFIISQGLLRKVRKSVPIEWVSRLYDDEVYLDVDTQHLEDLPKVED